jgi:hypothetical protein
MIRSRSNQFIRVMRFRAKLCYGVVASGQARETHSCNAAYLPKSTARKQLYLAGFTSIARKSRRHNA